MSAFCNTCFADAIAFNTTIVPGLCPNCSYESCLSAISTYDPGLNPEVFCAGLKPTAPAMPAEISKPEKYQPLYCLVYSLLILLVIAILTVVIYSIIQNKRR